MLRSDEIRELSDEDLSARVAELEEERFRLKFRSATETLEDPLRLRFIRRDIARLKTIAHERALGITPTPSAEEAEAPATRKSASRKTATRKSSAARKASTRKAATRKTAAKKAAAKKSGGARKSAAKKATARKSAAKKSTAKKAARKSSAKSAGKTAAARNR